MEIFIKIQAEKTNRFESHSFLSVECKVWNIGVRAHDIPIIAMLLQSCLALITRLVTFDIIILSYDSFIMSPLCYSNLNSDDKSFYLIVQTSGKSFGVRNQSITGEMEGERRGWDTDSVPPVFKSARGSWRWNCWHSWPAVDNSIGSNI